MGFPARNLRQALRNRRCVVWLSFSAVSLFSIPQDHGRSLDHVIGVIFGTDVFSNLIPIEISVELVEDYFPLFFSKEQISSIPPVTMKGYFINPFSLLKKQCEDFKLREYFFINRRPCLFPPVFSKRLTRLLRDDFNVFVKPFFILFLELCPLLVDVNFTPDKRTVSITNENYIYDMLTLQLKDKFLSLSYPITEVSCASSKPQGVFPKCASQNILSFFHSGESIMPPSEPGNKQSSILEGNMEGKEPFQDSGIFSNRLLACSLEANKKTSMHVEGAKEIATPFVKATNGGIFATTNGFPLEDQTNSPFQAVSNPIKASHTGVLNTSSVERSEISTLMTSKSSSEDSSISDMKCVYILTKEDFLHMDVVGQFNHGFILCSISKAENEKLLYICDQHACDEKFNYEAIKSSLKMGSATAAPHQKLLRFVLFTFLF